MGGMGGREEEWEGRREGGRQNNIHFMDQGVVSGDCHTLPPEVVRIGTLSSSILTLQGCQKRGGWGGLSRPTFRGKICHYSKSSLSTLVATPH